MQRKSVLDKAIEENNGELVDRSLNLVVEQGIDFQQDWFATKVDLAIKSNAPEALKILDKYNSVWVKRQINAQNSLGISSFAVAVARNKANLVECLLELGADINWHDAQYTTLLHVAAQNNALNAAEVLKAHSPQFVESHINSLNKKGNSPIVLAVFNQSVEMLDWLVRNGANVEWRDPSEKNRTLLRLAAEQLLRVQTKGNILKVLNILKAAYGIHFGKYICLELFEDTPFMVALKKENLEVTRWFRENEGCNNTLAEMQAVAADFKKKNMRLDWKKDQKDYVARFKELIEYAMQNICICKNFPEIPEIFANLYEIAKNYAALRYLQISPDTSYILICQYDADTRGQITLSDLKEFWDELGWEKFATKIFADGMNAAEARKVAQGVCEKLRCSLDGDVQAAHQQLRLLLADAQEERRMVFRQ